MKLYKAEVSYQYVSNIGDERKINRKEVWTDTQGYPTYEQA